MALPSCGAVLNAACAVFFELRTERAELTRL
jgi:hypothetical protein